MLGMHECTNMGINTNMGISTYTLLTSIFRVKQTDTALVYLNIRLSKCGTFKY